MVSGLREFYLQKRIQLVTVLADKKLKKRSPKLLQKLLQRTIRNLFKLYPAEHSGPPNGPWIQVVYTPIVVEKLLNG